MPFTARTRAQIRDAGLDYLTARFAALGKRVQRIKASFSFVLFDVLGLILEGYEQRAAVLADQIFVDTADRDNLYHHGAQLGVAPKGASAALRMAAIFGTNGATITFGTATLQTATGLSFRPVDATGAPLASYTLNGSGEGLIHIQCTTPGADGNIAMVVPLTWSSTPAGLNAVAVSIVAHKVVITGTPSAVITYGSNVLLSTDGIEYTPKDIYGHSSTGTTLDGSGNATIYANAFVSGEDGVQPAGATLTWDPATPAGLNATGEVQSGFGPSTGADAEDDAAYAARLLERIRERPGGGNRSDWRAWLEAFAGVKEAYVYPLYHSSLGEGTRGAVTVAIVGKAPSPPFPGTQSSRVLASSDASRAQDYIEGTRDAAGSVVAIDDQEQFRPVTVMAGDIFIVVPDESTVNVDMTVTVSAIAVPTWTNRTTDSGSTLAAIKLTTDPVAAGLAVGDYCGLANPAVRGGYEYFRIASMDSGTKTVVPSADTPLLTVPNSGLLLRPATSIAADVRDAILSVFDRLGPCDLASPTRWPPETEIGPSTLYLSALSGAVQSQPGLPGAPKGVPGVVGVSISFPAADVTLGGPPIAMTVPGTVTLTWVEA